MPVQEPVAELEPQFSDDDATPTPWAEARERLESAEVYWLTTMRPDGRPHVTPLVAVWLDDALADRFASKYDPPFQFTVRDFDGGGGIDLVFGVTPTRAFGFGKGRYSQTRWRF
jgi:hypothetical protein